jgi:dihydrofolate synthase/folylpolyglutamate synthase
LLAFIYFADLMIDVAVIEVGIGGRLDATNVITPLASIITSVGLDHIEQLGPTKAHIVKEKLGIVKESIPLFTAVKEDDLLNIMNEKCLETNSIFQKVDFERLKIKKMDLESSVFSYKGYDDLSISLVGMHQIENAVLALEVVDYLNTANKLPITADSIYTGLSNTRWPGRLECVSKTPLIYIDGGHNIDCIKRVCEFVNALNYSHKRVIISISADKDKKAMIELLDETFTEHIFTKYTYKRSATSNELYDISNSKNKIIIEDINDTIKYCFENQCEFTLFIGSLYLISEIRPLILNYEKKN